MVTDILQDRFEHMLKQRHNDIVAQPTGHGDLPQNLEPQTANLTPPGCVLPSSPRSYGMMFENWINDVQDDGSGIDRSLSTALELGPQASNTTCSNPNLPCAQVGSRDTVAENWESQSRPARISVVPNLETPGVITHTPPDVPNSNLSNRFDQASNLDSLATPPSADLETHLYV